MANEQRDQDRENTMAMTVDPVITWLEQIRDFIGATPESKDMAQRVLDRLRPPAQDAWAIVGALIDDLGDLRSNNGVLISNRPNHPSASADDAGYYGGYLVAESIVPRNATAMSFLPQLLVAAREHPAGRGILQQLAVALSTPPGKRDIVRDHLDGTIRLSRLATEFYSGSHSTQDDFYLVKVMLEHLAAGLLAGTIGAAQADIEAWLDGQREARRAARRGATS